MSRFSRRNTEGGCPILPRTLRKGGRPASAKRTTSLHRRAQPALRRRTIRPGRLAPAALAERSRHRHQLPRRRSAAAPRPRLGGRHSRLAHNSARAHLLLASLARPQRRGRSSHLLRVLLVVPARSRTRVVLCKNEARGTKSLDQLPQWRSPRSSAALSLGQVRSLSRR